MSTYGDPVVESVRAIEDDFADAMSRMYAVGNELARLRGRLVLEHSSAEWGPSTDAAPGGHPIATGDHPTATPAPVGAVTPPPLQRAPIAEAHPPTGGHVAPVPPVPPVPPLPSRSPVTPWWQREGVVAKVLAVVGTGITLIGVAFLLALAIQLGFFGPFARVASGGLLAVGLLVAAVLVRRRQASTAGALGLAATGIATAYLDVLAVTRIYEWVPAAVGLVLAGLIALGGLLLARAWESQLLAVVTVLGVAALAPVVGFDHLLLTGAFLVVLTSATWPAQISRSWHLLEVARVAPTALFVAVLPVTDEPISVVALLATAFSGFVLVTSLAGARTGALPRQAGPLLPVAALPMLVAGLASDRWLGASLLVALTCLLVLVAGLAAERRGTPLHLRLTETALATAGLTSLLAAARVAEGTEWSGPTLLGVCLLWAVAALTLRHRMTLCVALGTSALTLLGSLSLVQYVLLRGLAPDVGPAHLVAATAIVVLLLTLAPSVTASLPDLAPALPRVLIAGAVLWAGAAVILTGVLVGHLLDDPRGGFTAGQTGATLLWLGIAAALLLRGLRGSTMAVPAGLAIVAVSVGKLLLFDLAFLSGIARVLSFIVGGLLLLGMGAGYAQALERSRRSPTPPVENPPAPPGVPPTV